MKFNKKKVLAASIAVCLLAILSMGTLAWFNDSESVTNKFQVATSDDENPDDIFSIDVYEWVDSDGTDPSEKIEEGSYTFENVVPGMKLKKEPVVTNTGRYDQWVRLTISFKNVDKWYALQDGNTQDGPIKLLDKSEDWDEWEFASFDYTTGDYVYTYYLKTPLAPDQEVGTFTFVNIPKTLDQNDLFDIKELELDVKAEAVQIELGDTAKEAFTAYEQSSN